MELSEESFPTLLLISKLMKVPGASSARHLLLLSLIRSWGEGCRLLSSTHQLQLFFFSPLKFSLDTLYVSVAKHVFEKKLKPKLVKSPQAKSSTLINKEITKIAQTIESYLLSIVNPEWAVAIAFSLAQDIPEGKASSCHCP